MTGFAKTTIDKATVEYHGNKVLMWCKRCFGPVDSIAEFELRNNKGELFDVIDVRCHGTGRLIILSDNNFRGRKRIEFFVKPNRYRRV